MANHRTAKQRLPALAAHSARRIFTMLPLVAALSLHAAEGQPNFGSRGGQFIGFDSLSAFNASPGGNAGERVLTSPEIIARIEWDELIASWNAQMPEGGYLKVEVRGIYPDRTTKFFVMGLWSANTNQHPRESVLRQKVEDGDVSTDTLLLKKPCRKLQVRLTLGGGAQALPNVKFLCLALTESRVKPRVLPPNRAAWGKTIDVPERSQMAYPGGDVWCSPTTVSMLLAHWAQVLQRPELNLSVPEVVQGVFDPNWDGTGNWVFNTAFAGSVPGMRAYVARLSDVAEVEDWIAQGLPVGLSLCYNRLRGMGGKVSGHLVVCVGFTKDGDVIVNDPGTRENVRKTFPRKNLITAWATSKNAAYLIYPEETLVPPDRFGHWDSATARQRTKLVP